MSAQVMLEPQIKVGSQLDVPGLPRTLHGGGMAIDACSTIPGYQAGTSRNTGRLTGPRWDTRPSCFTLPHTRRQCEVETSISDLET